MGIKFYAFYVVCIDVIILSSTRWQWTAFHALFLLPIVILSFPFPIPFSSWFYHHLPVSFPILFPSQSSQIPTFTDVYVMSPIL